MIRLIKCLFCHKTTTLHMISVQKKINGKVITLTNAPVYYCSDCDETYLTKETQDVLGFIRDRGLINKKILFDFNDMSKKVYTNNAKVDS